MLAAAIAIEDEPDDDVGTDRADHANEVAEDFLMAPLLQRLFDAERVAEVHRAREVLLGAVVAMRGQQLLGSQHGQCLEELRTDFVLSTFTARRRHERRAKPLAVPVVRQHRVVLIVGVRRRHHQRPDGVELAKGQLERRLAAHRGDGLQLMLRWVGSDGEKNEDGEEEVGALSND